MKILFLWPDSESYWAKKMKKKGIDVDDAFYNYGLIYGAIRKCFAINNICLHEMLGAWKYKIFQYDVIFIQASRITVYIPSYLREKGYKGRVIYWYWDPVSGSVNPTKIANGLSEKWTFDKEDSLKYNLLFNDTFFLFDEKDEIVEDIENDILFIGRDKGRLFYLEKMREVFSKIDVRCNFYIVPTKPYSLNAKKLKKPLSYDRVLQMVSKSNILLDITQNNQSGLSQRCMEALYFNKKIITNNEYITGYSFYTQDMVYILKKEIDEESLIRFINKKNVGYPMELKRYYSFESWLERICRGN